MMEERGERNKINQGTGGPIGPFVDASKYMYGGVAHIFSSWGEGCCNCYWLPSQNNQLLLHLSDQAAK